MLRVQLFHHLPHQDSLNDEIPAGPTTIVVETAYAEQRPAGPLDIALRVGQEVLATGRVPVKRRCCSPPMIFDIGICLGSPVSEDYYDEARFPFNGHIDRVHVAYT